MLNTWQKTFKDSFFMRPWRIFAVSLIPSPGLAAGLALLVLQRVTWELVALSLDLTTSRWYANNHMNIILMAFVAKKRK